MAWGDRWAALASRSLGWVRWVVGAAFVTGVALLVLLLSRADVHEVWARLNGVSSSGLAIILATYLAGFLAETASWLLAIAMIPAQPRTFYRLCKVLMVGNAVERVTPFGGEPIKVLLLNRYESIPYAAASASLVITRMTDVMALIFFITRTREPSSVRPSGSLPEFRPGSLYRSARTGSMTWSGTP
jgi:uncharacterized membrane protein YbhN (UPF0104 family)